MFCTVCATLNPVAAHHCQTCGGFLTREALPRAGRRASPPPDAHRHRSRTARRLAAPALVVAPLLALLAIVAGYHRAEQAELAASYLRAEAAIAAGRYDEALDAYAAAGDYRDADARHRTLASQLDPHRAAYADGVAALGAGRYGEAIAALLPVARDLPRYEDAAGLLAEARRLLAADLRRQADAAEARRDWLAAERALVALAAADPGDAAVADRLAELRREHAPIAFARDHALYLVGPDGADERLLTADVPVSRPIWSPDRSRIVFVSSDPSDSYASAELYVIDAGGGDPRRLVGAVHPNAVPVWSPDGTRIAYTSVADYNLRRDVGLLSVHVVDVATGRDTNVTGRMGRHAMTPSWSPIGDRLAFIGRARPDGPAQTSTSGPGDVYALTFATGEIANLTHGRVPDLVRVQWSPARDQLLLFARTWDSTGLAGERARLVRLDAASGTLTEVVAEVETATAAWAPAWAPDGTRFAYVEGDRTVVVQDANGEETRVETEDYLAGALTWAPDGQSLLAIAADPRQPSTIVSFGPPGLRRPTLTPLPIDYDTDWPTGSPVWAPLNPTPPPATTTVGGTALDQNED